MSRSCQYRFRRTELVILVQVRKRWSCEGDGQKSSNSIICVDMLKRVWCQHCAAAAAITRSRSNLPGAGYISCRPLIPAVPPLAPLPLRFVLHSNQPEHPPISWPVCMQACCGGFFGATPSRAALRDADHRSASRGLRLLQTSPVQPFKSCRSRVWSHAGAAQGAAHPTSPTGAAGVVPLLSRRGISSRPSNAVREASDQVRR